MLFLSIFFRNDARDNAKDIDPSAKKDTGLCHCVLFYLQQNGKIFTHLLQSLFRFKAELEWNIICFIVYGFS
jgi:hypothetical protein